VTVHVVLFRGINVGGTGIVRMVDLRALLGELGFEDVATYVQSGNVVLRSSLDPAAVALSIAEAMEPAFGIAPQIMVRDADAWGALVAGNPMPEAAAEPKQLHALALGEAPSADAVARLEQAERGSERFAFGDGVLYLHTPDGIGRSKFAATIERTLAVPATARNWRTVLALQAMAEEAEASGAG
jgi:uncharacterized protein (DUF1697 family)